MSMGIDFSVATATRNDLQKLRRCLGSVRGQLGVSVEHLVQDACSTDGTPQWLQSQAGVLAVSEADLGMYDAIGRAWQRSSGRYLCWLNADEQYLPGTLAFVHDWFERHPDVSVVFGDYIVARPDGTPVALRREIPFRRPYVANGFLNAASCATFFRRSLLDRGLLAFDDSLRYAADKDLMLRLHAAGIQIEHVSRIMSVFGIDGTNLSTHQQMKEEVERVRVRHGAFRSLALRQLVMLGRTLERTLRGGYRAQDVSFLYATNEEPSYQCVQVQRLGGRYSLADGIQPSTRET